MKTVPLMSDESFSSWVSIEFKRIRLQVQIFHTSVISFWFTSRSYIFQVILGQFFLSFFAGKKGRFQSARLTGKRMRVMKAAGHRATPLSQWFPGAGIAGWWVSCCGRGVFKGELPSKFMDGKILRQFCDHDWYSLITGNDKCCNHVPSWPENWEDFFWSPKHSSSHAWWTTSSLYGQNTAISCQIYNDYRISTSIFTKNIPRTQHLSSRSFFNSFKLPLIRIITSPWKA